MKTIQNSLNTAQLFWLCAGVYFLAWMIVPTLAISNVPTDTLEGYAWGHEWQLGTYKHPPLAGWVLEALAVLTNRAAWAHFLANELAVITTFWAVWQTGRRMVSETAALIGALLLAVIPYYNIIIPEFNPNVLQLPFWALIGWSFHKAVKDNKTIDWLLLGVWSAASLYTKYSSALLLAALAGLMLWHPDARQRLRSKGPWLTILTASLLLTPHIIWLFKNNFMPFTYAEDRFEHLPYGPAFILVPALFIFWQAATLLPAIVLYCISFRIPAPLSSPLPLAGEDQGEGVSASCMHRMLKHGRLMTHTRGRPRAPSPTPLPQQAGGEGIFGRFLNPPSFDQAFLYCITFGPAIITGLIAALSGGVIRTMWATPFWNFIGLWAVFCFQPELSSKNLRRFASLWSFIFVAGLTGFFCVEDLGPYVTHKAKRINFSGERFAAQISKVWHERYHQPLHYVIGDTWTGGTIAWYAPDRPHQLTDGNYNISPWINPADLKKYGGVIVWCGARCDTHDQVSPPAYIQTTFPQAQIQPPLIFPQNTAAKVPEGMVEWAILPPQGATTAP
jgi:4-amino-4-deoxy-L-arabinose transferase-like glycosyltransferase